MKPRILLLALVLAPLLNAPARADDNFVTFKSMSIGSRAGAGPRRARRLPEARLPGRPSRWSIVSASPRCCCVTATPARLPCRPPRARPGPRSVSAPTPATSCRYHACRRTGVRALPGATVLAGGVMVEAARHAGRGHRRLRRAWRRQGRGLRQGRHRRGARQARFLRHNHEPDRIRRRFRRRARGL